MQTANTGFTLPQHYKGYTLQFPLTGGVFIQDKNGDPLVHCWTKAEALRLIDEAELVEA